MLFRHFYLFALLFFAISPKGGRSHKRWIVFPPPAFSFSQLELHHQPTRTCRAAHTRREFSAGQYRYTARNYPPPSFRLSPPPKHTLTHIQYLVDRWWNWERGGASETCFSSPLHVSYYLLSRRLTGMMRMMTKRIYPALCLRAAKDFPLSVSR